MNKPATNKSLYYLFAKQLHKSKCISTNQSHLLWDGTLLPSTKWFSWLLCRSRSLEKARLRYWGRQMHLASCQMHGKWNRTAKADFKRMLRQKRFVFYPLFVFPKILSFFVLFSLQILTLSAKWNKSTKIWISLKSIGATKTKHTKWSRWRSKGPLMTFHTIFYMKLWIDFLIVYEIQVWILVHEKI